MHTRQVTPLGGKDVGQHGGQVLQQMEAVRDLAGCGRPAARRVCVRFGTIAHEYFNPGMRL
jgi:hypothetical protein